jgi:tryptophanyl-tRNA synthetase
MSLRPIVVSGIRSTGFLHLGNYFGAMRNYARMQADHTCYFFVADYHSLTTHPDPADLRASVYRVVAETVASGVDPEQCALFAQSDVPEIPELYLLLNTLAYKGELEKVPTFKDKVRAQPQNVNAGLLTYPVLMTADILIHRAALVPVGKDQEQHLEMARNFAQRFNSRYGELFPEPQPFNYGAELVKVPSLDGAGKMSKSEHGSATIYLADDDDAIRKKVMKAKSDAGPEGEGTPLSEAATNLLQLLRLASGDEAAKPYEESWAGGFIRYGDLKKQLAEEMVHFVSPIREKAAALQNDSSAIQRILRSGAEKARASAAATLAEARRLVGIRYY